MQPKEQRSQVSLADEDCKLTELWRIPLIWVPKVQRVTTRISQAKGQSAFSLKRMSFAGCVLCHPYFFGGQPWKHFLINWQVSTM